jgi:hypothetical protein
MRFLSQKNIQRLLFIFLFLLIFVIKNNVLFVYEALFYISYEYLNSNKKYLEIRNHTIYNWLFIGFLMFVILVRSKWFFISESVDYHLNTVEHLFFSGIVCLILRIYFQIFNFNLLWIKSLLLAFIAFNFIGLINEYFQNFFQQTPILLLEEGDVKDIYVNLAGSVLYLAVASISRIKI